mgnify:CR=1 FL=1
MKKNDGLTVYLHVKKDWDFDIYAIGFQDMQTVSNAMAEVIRKTDKHRFAIPFLEAMGRLEEGCCLPGQIIIEETRLPIMVNHIPHIGFEYFGIRKGPFELEHNWRYLTSQDDDELIQLNLYMMHGRILVCNLAPEFKAVRRFLKEIYTLKHFGFFFYSKSERLFLSSFCGLDTEELGWLKRNRPRVEKVKKNNAAAIMTASMIQHEQQEKDAKFYLCAEEPEKTCFAGQDAPTVPFARINEYL